MCKKCKKKSIVKIIIYILSKNKIYMVFKKSNMSFSYEHYRMTASVWLFPYLYIFQSKYVIYNTYMYIVYTMCSI